MKIGVLKKGEPGAGGYDPQNPEPDKFNSKAHYKMSKHKGPFVVTGFPEILNYTRITISLDGKISIKPKPGFCWRATMRNRLVISNGVQFSAPLKFP